MHGEAFVADLGHDEELGVGSIKLAACMWTGVLHDQLGVPFLQVYFGRCCWKMGMWQPSVSCRLELL